MLCGCLGLWRKAVVIPAEEVLRCRSAVDFPGTAAAVRMPDDELFAGEPIEGTEL